MKIEAKSRPAKWENAPSSPFKRDSAIDRPERDLATLVLRTLPEAGDVVLAVSGGLDSMVLLDVAAALRQKGGWTLQVATFDHASGGHSARAAEFVAGAASRYGLPVVIGRADVVARTEAAWRAARWEFLRSVASSTNAHVVTAHTRDDQIETILMRAMRGTGIRGLAGLLAPSPIRRPFVDVRRAELRTHAAARGLRWLEDPTNRSPRFLRNRVRRDLLPALARVWPGAIDELLEVGARAASWRRELAALVDSRVEHHAHRDPRGEWSLDVRAEDLVHLTSEAHRIVWPELASRIGVTLDRRGTMRAAEFTSSGEAGGRIQLSGGWELLRSRQSFELRRRLSSPQRSTLPAPLAAPMTWSAWRFAVAELVADRDPWQIALPKTLRLTIRGWRAGDRIVVRHGERFVSRKVKYFLSDSRISGHIRGLWPVVVAGDEIVWIPGVRRSDAATVRSGGPVVTYVCDYLDRRP
jgi:tRNA(Ile)-lysidine synthase